MAVPTISALSPNVGATGGGHLVEITGTNFRTWTIPPASGAPAGPIQPTVEVLFGGAASSEVIVLSATRLYAMVPRTALASVAPNFGEGAVDVVVRNLDDDGVLIPGETVTRAGGYTYRRVQLSNESDLNRLCRALIREFRVQVHPNVTFSSHTDYDSDAADGLNIVDLAQVPGIALLGPDLSENRFYSQNQRQAYPAGGVERVVRRVPYTVDVSFGIVGVCELKTHAINLMAVVQGFFELNKTISMDRDPADLSKGRVSYIVELAPDGDLKMARTANNSNLRFFSGSFIVRGFDLEDLTGFTSHQAVARTGQITQDPTILVEQKTEDGEDE